MTIVKTYKWHTLYQDGDNALLTNNEWGTTPLIFLDYKDIPMDDIDAHVDLVDNQYTFDGQVTISKKN